MGNKSQSAKVSIVSRSLAIKQKLGMKIHLLAWIVISKHIVEWATQSIGQNDVISQPLTNRGPRLVLFFSQGQSTILDNQHIYIIIRI
jgi:hypothetical protein